MMTRNRFLILLHRYNGWNLLFLLVSGIILYLPALRTATSAIRVPLKWAHIASGVLMTAILLAYLPALSGHWDRLGRRLGQRLNVLLIFAITMGWIVTGYVLTFYRSLPPEWASTSLVWHDYLTWLVLPWLAIHSYTRYFKVKWEMPAWLTGAQIEEPEPDAGRRDFVTQAVAAIGAGAWSLFGWRALTGPQEPAGDSLSSEPQSSFVDAPHPIIQAPGKPLAPDFPAPAVAAPMGIFPDTQPPHTDFDPPVPFASKLPPSGGGKQGRFRIYTVTNGFPAFHPQHWSFFAQGLVDSPLHLTWKEFLHLPRQEQVSDFHCVTGWSVYKITWEGVRLRDLLAMLKVKPEADHVKFYSHDGEYTDDLPLDVAMQDDIMLAYLMDAQPLPVQNGGPMRLIIPRMYAYKSVKWLAGMELIKGPHEGYWEERGYPRNAWVGKV